MTQDQSIRWQRRATFDITEAVFTVYWMAFCAEYEQQRHRTETSCSHTSNILPAQLAERVW